MYFIIPLIDYLLNENVVISNGSNNEHIIQGSGAYVLQLFSFFQDPHGYNSVLITDRFCLTPGAMLMTALFTAVFLCVSGCANTSIKKLMVFSLIMICVSTNIFPWDKLALNSEIGNFFAQVQYPWRYLSVACISLSVLLGFLLLEISSKRTEKRYLVVYTAVLIPILSTVVFCSQYISGIKEENFYSNADVSHYAYSMGEYLKVMTNGDPVLGWKSNDNMFSVPKGKDATVQLQSREGSSMYVLCGTDETEGTVVFPLFNYKGYRVADNSGAEFVIEDDEYGRISITLPPKYHGIIHVDFQEPWYWRLSELISLTTCILTIYYFICRRKRLSIGGTDDKKV